MREFLTVIIGPLTGSFLAGMVAFFIMRKNQSYDALKEKRKVNNNFFKATYVYNHALKHIEEGLEAADAFKSVDVVFFQKKQFLTVSHQIIKQGLGELEKIPDDYIIHESYQHFLETKAIVSILEEDFNNFLLQYQEENQNNSYLLTVDFKKTQSELRELQNEIMKIKNDISA